MLFNNLILLPLLFCNKNLVSDTLAKLAHSLDVRKFQGLILTLLAT